MAYRCWCHKVHPADCRHHHLTLREAAGRQKRGLGHQLQTLARKQRAVVVGQRRQYQFLQFNNADGLCHASQFTQNALPWIALKWRISANEKCHFANFAN